MKSASYCEKIHTFMLEKYVPRDGKYSEVNMKERWKTVSKNDSNDLSFSSNDATFARSLR